MKLVCILMIVFTLLFGGPVFGPATIWPDSLDELYVLIETGQGNWVFTQPCTEQPVIPWSAAKALATSTTDGERARVVVPNAASLLPGLPPGRLDISEEQLFTELLRVALAGTLNGEAVTCKPDGEKVGLQGWAARELLARLSGYVSKN